MPQLTIKDLAKAAQTSTSTVNRALTNSGRVSAETRERVIAAAKRMGYRADWNARSMVTGKTNLIGLIIGGRSGSTYGFEVIGSIDEAVSNKSIHLLTQTAERTVEAESRAIEVFLARRVDGVVVMSPSHFNEGGHLDVLPNAGIPTVVINRYCASDRLHKIHFDHRQAGFDMTSRFLRNGHARVAFIGENEMCETRAHQEILTGYREAMKSIGRYDFLLEASRALKARETADAQLRAGADMAKELISRFPDLTAIFVLDDYKAIGAMRYLRDIGRRIPQDIAVASQGNLPGAIIARPSLTTCVQPVAEAGTLAASLLAAEDSCLPTTHLLRYSLDVRESCGINETSRRV